ncbi:hypothetical protein [Priestia aryabhattai]|uniref:hypothetical protein n=1 Tax=Priestia aryabhattai TaxID=412384 RepID=UPI001C8DDB0E|nr:hypothetical protein [Priestia aryabhattai]MBX9996077.1 hypothetical protein [Priestia aryabhattai]
MKHLLNRFKNTDLLEIYTYDGDVNKCLVGYILQTNEKNTLLAIVGTSGLYDGHYVISTESVVSVATETEYLKKIESLYNLKKQTHPVYTGNTEDLIVGGLEFSKEQNYIVSLMLLDSEEYSTTGFVKEIIESETVVITEVDSFGFIDGKRFIDIEAIEHLTINGEEEQDMKLLFNHNI